MVIRRKLKPLDLSVLLVVGIVFFFFEKISLRETPARYHNLKKKASFLTFDAFQVVKEEFLRRGGKIDPVNDPGETSLIGLRTSPITTDEGDLSAKLTSVNPNFSALFVDIFKKLKLKRGDYIAVGMTGSFPALNIALILSAQIMGLKPIIISSVGSSSWGANLPDWTYLDIENFLYSSNVLKYKSVAASLGGADDVGRGLMQEERKLLKDAIERNNVPVFIKEKPLESAIERRMEIYDSLRENKRIKLFVNIGGGIANFGIPDLHYYIKSGLNMPYPEGGELVDFSLLPVKGVIVRFLERGIPVLNLTDINGIAEEYKLPISPASIPLPGEGPLFFEEKHPVSLLSIQLFLYLFVLFIILYIDIFYFFKKDDFKGEDSV